MKINTSNSEFAAAINSHSSTLLNYLHKLKLCRSTGVVCDGAEGVLIARSFHSSSSHEQLIFLTV